MLKNLFLSTVAVASLGLSQSYAMTSDDMISDNPTSSSSSSTSSKPTKLQPVVTEAFLNGPNLNNSLNEDGTPDHDNNRLNNVFAQPLMDTLLHLASPCHRDSKGVYLPHESVISLMEALYPLKSHFVKSTDWYRHVFYSPDVTDAFLAKEGLTREEYDYFWTESQAQFDAEVHKKTASLKASDLETLPAASGVKLTQLATYQLLKESTFQKQLGNEYETYVRLVSKIKTPNLLSINFSFARNDLTILPPSSLWSHLTALQGLHLSRNRITDVGPLQQMTGLMFLDLSHNRITDVGPLQQMTGLIDLHLHDNQITDVGPLQKMMALRIVVLQKNPNLWTPVAGESSEASQGRIQANCEVVRLLSARGCRVLLKTIE